jgi:hypothetical protein
MDNDIRRLHELLREGTCCAVALVQLALEHRGEHNEQLLLAVSGLCGGVRSGLVCGALTGAVCMMNVLDPERASPIMVPELVAWFTDAMEHEYGGINCANIIAGVSLNKTTRCPAVIEETYRHATEILRSHGYEFGQSALSSSLPT